MVKTKTVLFVLMLCLLAACNGGQSDSSTQANGNVQATVAALAAENARLTTAVATLSKQSEPAQAQSNQSAAKGAAVAASAPLSTTEVLTSANNLVPVKDPSAEPGPLPNVLAEIPLAPQGAALIDFRLDSTAGRMYVTDNAGHLYVLDAATHALLATLPASGDLTLDAARHRLYVAPADSYPMEKPVISVIDTQAVTVTATIPNASHLALDTTHNRLFVGNRLYATSDAKTPGVRILNADSLAVIATIPQTGIPVYNSLRNELLIVAYTIFAADPDKAVVKQDLLPEISRATSMRWCNGCTMALNAYSFPAENLLAFDIQSISVGKGAGLQPSPRFVDATSLAAVEKAADVPVIQPGCGSEKSLLKAINGRIYRHQAYNRYVFYNNLFVYDLAGNLVTWRDGLEQPFINVQTNQAYANGWVLDLDSLMPLGQMPLVCLFQQDTAHGALYGSRQGALVLLSERGGQMQTSAPGVASNLPKKAITKIVASPTYANDNTLFLLSEASSLYRSVDGGQQWTALRRGLAMNAYATLSLALSPNFAQDHTLFTGGYVGDGWGEGVLRSTDGGNSWQPLWHNLTTLRVYQLALSPTYTTDGTLLAYAHYTRLTPMQTGVAVQRSNDQGVSWSLALTTTDDAKLPSPNELLGVPVTEPALPLRIVASRRQLERTIDGGQTWAAIDLNLPEAAFLTAIVPSPHYPTDGTLYILGDYEVWRATDNGATIQPWGDARLRNRTFENKLSTLALSPPLSADNYRLFVGTNAGEFWTLNSAQIQWHAPVQGTGPVKNSPATTSVVTPTMQAAVNLPAATSQPAPAQPVTTTKPITTALVPMTSTTVGGPTPVPGGPTPTPPPPLAGEPPAGLYRPGGAFASQWEKDTQLQQVLGWAKEPVSGSTEAAIQTFDHGTMIWRGDTKKIYVIYSDRTWAIFEDTFKEGQTESDPGIRAPQGKLQPVRGFGKVWRDHDNVRNKLGWATAKEQGISSPIHTFEHGFMIRSGGLVYALVETAEGKGVWY